MRDPVSFRVAGAATPSITVNKTMIGVDALAPRLPALTWQRSSLVVCASVGAANVQAAIESAINELTGDQGWTAVAATGANGALIAPPTSSPIADFRAHIGYGSPAQAQVAPALAGGAPDTAGSIPNHPLLNIGPDGITGANNWYDANPFGAGRRSFGLWPMWQLNLITKVQVYATEETLLLTFRGGSDTVWGWAHLGAIIEPFTANGAEADGRVYGMMVKGNHSSGIPTAWFTAVDDNYGSGHHRDADTGCHAGCFDGATPANRLAFYLSNFYDGGTEYTSFESDRGTNEVGRLFEPLFAHQTTDALARNWVANLGRMRGLFFGGKLALGQELMDADGTVRGYGISSQVAADQQALAMMNE